MKTKAKSLGTVETLSSLFADVQALVMDLKNMVEQCLSEQSTYEDSFCVTLSPMMSSILGVSQGGGAQRYDYIYGTGPISRQYLNSNLTHIKAYF